MQSLHWVYLITYMACGNFLETSRCRQEERRRNSAFRCRDEQLPGVSIEPDFPTPIPIRLSMGAADKLSRKFQDLRAVVMTKNKRAQAAIPHQDRRSLSCLAWFSSPRGTTCTTQLRREMKTIRRISHGNARSIESLRGLRLPLVPASNSRECILQRMSDKA